MLESDGVALDTFPVGTKVRLAWGSCPQGRVIEVEPPLYLIAPKFICQWDDGNLSGRLSASDLIKITEEANEPKQI